MDRGTILFHRAFKFKDGEIGQKLLIILNTPLNDESYLCCKTTSKKKYNLEKEGCYSDDNIYVLNPVPDCFKVKTWAQFQEIYEFDKYSLLQDHFKSNVTVVGTLPIHNINAIINCIKKSKDISKYHLNLLK